VESVSQHELSLTILVRDPRIGQAMRVFNVPLSVPFLRAVIAGLIDGRLVEGFEARNQPARLADATLYLPTRRAMRLAREVFLDELNTDAVILPRIVALGDID
jgi:ATP-dependent helicase/nuclease subunit B